MPRLDRLHGVAVPAAKAVLLDNATITIVLVIVVIVILIMKLTIINDIMIII